jgi:hypothetical protein
MTIRSACTTRQTIPLPELIDEINRGAGAGAACSEDGGGVDLVVTDLDGSLWSDPEAVQAHGCAARARTAEDPVLVATGRHVGSTREPLARLRVRRLR